MEIFDRLKQDERAKLDRVMKSYPIKLGELANELGVKVFVATLPAGISGEIKKIHSDAGGGEYIIRVNRHESRERQRFTLAHELAHYLLHREQIGDGLSDDALYRSRLSNNLEYEANRFAADILMPKDRVKYMVKEISGDDERLIDEVSKAFGVSKQAAQIRLGL